MSRSTRRRYQHVDNVTTTYMNLRKQGVPQRVTSHEAFRMTEGRVGTKGDHNGAHGFTLMNLVKRADGNVVALADTPDTCIHDERLPIPGLAAVEACMDCGSTFTAEQVQPEDDGTVAEALAPVQDPKPTGPEQGDVVSYTGSFRAHGADAPRWRVRLVDPSDGTLTLDLLGHSKRSTARFGVDPGKVTIRVRMQDA